MQYDSLGRACRLWVVLLSVFVLEGVTYGGDTPPEDALHHSGNQTLWDRRNNIVTLKGNAAVHRVGESLYCDWIRIDLNKRFVDAEGNCLYYANETVVQAKEMHMSLADRTGTIIEGSISNGNFQLSSKLIEKLSDKKYKTERATYSTCKDCSESWEFEVDAIEIEFEGYAFMRQVKLKIKDTPVMWIPYMIIPIKQERQSGLVYPHFDFSGIHGLRFVQPLYLTLGRSADMTLGGGIYTFRGGRGELEFRYAARNDSYGTVKGFYTYDKQFKNPRTGIVQPSTRNRYALSIEQQQRFPKLGLTQKFRLFDISDNRYPIDFDQDIRGRFEPAQVSDLSFNFGSPWVSSYVAGRYVRDLLGPVKTPRQANRHTVQVLPEAQVVMNDRLLFGLPVAAGVRFGLHNFVRPGEAFDPGLCSDTQPETCPTELTGAPVPGVDPVREALRVELNPRIYSAFRPWDRISVVPSLGYRTFYYNFFTPELSPLWRGYLQFKTDFSFQLERVYKTSNPEIPRIKHMIRPILSYSWIPQFSIFSNRSNHGFIAQVESPYQYVFDTRDVVPLSTQKSLVNYFVPQGHSLSYGVRSELIRRKGKMKSKENPTYQKVVETSIGQTVDFLEFNKPKSDRAPFSRIFWNLTLTYDRFTWRNEYYYYPHLRVLQPNVIERPHQFTTNFSFILDNTVRDHVYTFDRSLGFAYTYSQLNGNTSNLRGNVNFSLSTYWHPRFSMSYDLNLNRVSQVDVSLAYQSPSRCWELSLGWRWAADRGRLGEQGNYGEFSGQGILLNLTGYGFGNVTNMASAGGIVK